MSIALLVLTITSKCQSKETKTNVLYEKTSNVEEYEPITYITYVTKNRDTLFVMESIYSLFDEIWSNPKLKNEKPILVSVSMSTLASYYPKEKKKKNKKKKDKVTTTKINNKKSKKKRVKVKDAKKNSNSL